MNYLIKEMTIAERPRERLKFCGAAALSDAELLAILLRTGSKDNNVLSLAQTTLNNLDGLQNLNNTSLNTLSKIKGIGEVKAITILAALELGKRLLKPVNRTLIINNNRILYDMFKYEYLNEFQEKLIAVFLDSKKQLLTYKVIFIGTLDASTVHPREIMKEAIKNSSASIIIVHNHPSGNSIPSHQDQLFTEKMYKIGTLVGIPIIDHIIIGHNNYYSFFDQKRVDIDE